MKISIVIPTYKRQVLLKRCLESLIKQDFANDDYEVIVVDNEASEETLEIVEKLRSACVF